MYRDDFGLIVQRDLDGGDTCQRTGMWAFGKFIEWNRGNCESLIPYWDGRWQLQQALKHLEKDGILIRHPGRPGTPSFWSDPNELSRDQQDALVIACGAYRLTAVLERIYDKHKSRWFKYQNKDVPTLQTFGVWIRAWRSKWLWPVLCVTDLGLLVNAILIWWDARKDVEESDDVNHIMRLAQAQEVLPTPVSYLARKLYKRIRPWCCGWFLVEGRDRVEATLAWYFHEQTGANTEFYDLWAPIVRRF